MARFRQIVGLGAAVTPGRPVCTTAIGAMAEAAIRGLVGLDERVFGVRKVLGLSSPTLIEIAPGRVEFQLSPGKQWRDTGWATDRRVDRHYRRWPSGHLSYPQ